MMLWGILVRAMGLTFVTIVLLAWSGNLPPQKLSCNAADVVELCSRRITTLQTSVLMTGQRQTDQHRCTHTQKGQWRERTRSLSHERTKDCLTTRRQRSPIYSVAHEAVVSDVAVKSYHVSQRAHTIHQSLSP